MLTVICAECHIKAFYAESGYTECHYAECHYADCRGADLNTFKALYKMTILKTCSSILSQMFVIKCSQI
jgi:hypothetical protein